MSDCVAFPLAAPLRSTHSSAGRPASFAGFAATTEASDFSVSCVTGFGLLGLPGADPRLAPMADAEISRFPDMELADMLGVYDPAGSASRSR